tara:strand:+ start:2574 stop:2813 length:240 start_codon:yes stop_codon:yes gene_type:complete
MKSILSHEQNSDKRYRCSYSEVALKIKESIKRHKWIEGEKGRLLTWDEAKKEWLSLQPKYQQGWLKLHFHLEDYMLDDE